MPDYPNKIGVVTSEKGAAVRDIINIIERRYNEMNIDENFTAKDMYNDLKTVIHSKGRCYLFLDELQEVDGWEKVVNNLLEGCDVDIMYSGFNRISVLFTRSYTVTGFI